MSALPLRLHHNAYVCADQERTRHFYEDIVGLPLLAAWIEEAEFPEFPGRRTSYSHAFYGIGDGGALAFFNFADPEAAAAYQAKKQPTFIHIALAVTDEAQRAIKQRLEARQPEGARSRPRLLQVDLRPGSGRAAGRVHRPTRPMPARSPPVSARRRTRRCGAGRRATGRSTTTSARIADARLSGRRGLPVP